MARGLYTNTNVEALNARRYMDRNSIKLGNAQQELASGSSISDPSSKPSDAAVCFILDTTINILGQASKNAAQAIALLQMTSGVLGNTVDILSRLATLASQANTDGIDPAKRAMIDNEYQSLLSQIDQNAQIQWGSQNLLTGNAGMASLVTTATSSNGTYGAFGAYTGNATIFTTAGLGSSGFVEGVVSNINVIEHGGFFDVSLNVGNQTFTGTTDVSASTLFSLYGTRDSSNRVQVSFSNSTGIAPLLTAGVTTASTFRDALNAFFNVHSGSPLGFKASNNVSGTISQGMTSGALTFTSLGAGAIAGTYGISYDSFSNVFRLTNGNDVYTATALDSTGSTVAPGANMTGSATFGDGTKISLTNFSGSQLVFSNSQTLFYFSQGTGTNMVFQVGKDATSTVSIFFQGATSTILGLTNTNVLTKDSAGNVAKAVSTAINIISNQIASMGGVKSRLDFITKNLEISIQNQAAAKSTFGDADIADALQRAQQYQALFAMASSTFQQSLRKAVQLAQLVESTSRG